MGCGATKSNACKSPAWRGRDGQPIAVGARRVDKQEIERSDQQAAEGGPPRLRHRAIRDLRISNVGAGHDGRQSNRVLVAAQRQGTSRSEISRRAEIGERMAVTPAPHR